jgi:DNA-binding NtrC family response regulator
MGDYHDQFPRADGPPPVENYTGAKLFNDVKGTVTTIKLDPGAMRAVWEVLEAEAKRRYPSHAMPGTGALLRAVEAFRTGYWDVHEKPAPKRKPTGKVAPATRVRKNAKLPDTTKVRRVVKRPVLEVRSEVPARRVRRVRPRSGS